MLLARTRMNAKPLNWFSSPYSPPLPCLGTRILGDSVFNKMEKFSSFPSTLKIVKFSLYELNIASLHLRVCRFAIQWFVSLKEAHVLKKNMPQPLNDNSHLREVSRERLSPQSRSWLSLPADQRDSRVQDGPWVQSIAKHNPPPRPAQPIHPSTALRAPIPLPSCLILSPAA